MEALSLKLFNNSEFIFMALGIALIVWSLSFLRRFKVIDRNFKIILLTAVFAFLSFYDLGSFSIAKSTYDPQKARSEIVLEVSDDFDTIYTIAGLGDNNANNGTYQIYYRSLVIQSSASEDGPWSDLLTLDDEEFFKYTKSEVATCDRFIRLLFKDPNGVLSEIWFVKDGKPVDVKLIRSTEADAYKVIDEQDTFKADPDYKDETYFDEIYHARNALEIANGQKMYTAVHPLLGTGIMALMIKLFGFSPFIFRMAGSFFSVMMIPLVYLFAKEFFKEKWAFLVALFFSVDFMHYTTGRIATLEPFSVFFIILMFYMLIKALKIDYTKDLKRHFFFLALSGLSMGLAISVKWTGVYGALGMAVLYFIFEIRYFLKAKRRSDNNLFKKTALLLLWSILFFIVIPLGIYTASFLFVRMYPQKWSNLSEFIDQVIRYNTYMIKYHTGLDSTHPYSSRWYMWLFDIRPIWYYVKRSTDHIQTISCFSNPLLTIAATVAMFYSIYILIKRKKRDLALLSLVIMYLSLLLPWILVSRTSFAYHYYPCIPFALLILVYTLRSLYGSAVDKEKAKRYIKIFVIVSVILFVLFLPVIGGFKTNYYYVQIVLRWLPTWYFG